MEIATIENEKEMFDKIRTYVNMNQCISFWTNDLNGRTVEIEAIDIPYPCRVVINYNPSNNGSDFLDLAILPV